MKVTKHTTIGEAVKNHPETIEVMLNYGLHCIGCNVSYEETIGQGTAGHGWDEQRLEGLLKEMNEAIRMEEEKQSTNSGSAQQSQRPQLTSKAAEKLRELMGKKGNGTQRNYLKITAIPGGCAGYTYGLSFEEKATQGDEIVETGDVKLLLEKESAGLLSGIRIDFVDALQGAGFKISNPNAKSSCSCGQSFG